MHTPPCCNACRFFEREKAKAEPKYGYGIVNGKYIPLSAEYVKRESARRFVTPIYCPP